jgi:hypothetical protein
MGISQINKECNKELKEIFKIFCLEYEFMKKANYLDSELSILQIYDYLSFLLEKATICIEMFYPRTVFNGDLLIWTVFVVEMFRKKLECNPIDSLNGLFNHDRRFGFCCLVFKNYECDLGFHYINDLKVHSVSTCPDLIINEHISIPVDDKVYRIMGDDCIKINCCLFQVEKNKINLEMQTNRNSLKLLSNYIGFEAILPKLCSIGDILKLIKEFELLNQFNGLLTIPKCVIDINLQQYTENEQFLLNRL